MALLSFIGSLCTAGGYLLLMPLTKYVTGSLEVIKVKGFEIATTPLSIGLLLFLIVIFVFAGIHINYRYYVKTLDVMRSTIIESAVRGLMALKAFDVSGTRKQAVRGITNTLSFSCGFVMRQFASGLTDTVQVMVFFVVLFSINPVITLVFLLFVLVSGFLMLRSMNKVTDVVSKRQQHSQAARQEFDALSQFIENSEVNEKELRQKLQYLYKKGLMGEIIDRKLGIRRESRRAPLFVEYLFPLALVMIPLVTYVSGSLQDQAPQLVAYLFVLRNVIGALKRFASLIMSTGRLYPGLLCYYELLSGKELPPCLFQVGPKTGEDVDEEEEE